jgi:trans-aconitate methyltransferase
MEDDRKTDEWDARLYDEKYSFIWKHGESLIELLAPQSGECILDLGCGTGHLTARIAAAGASVLGIDSSAEMIEQARRSYPYLRVEIGDARYLIHVERFDAVFSNAVLHWIKDADMVVRGLHRALKPGGRFVAEFGGKRNLEAILAATLNALQAVGCGNVDLPWFFPSVAEYSSLLEKQGLEVAFASLFDRPTPLEGEAGMRHWIEMFGGPFLSRVPQDRREDFFRNVENELRPVLHRDGVWFADYRRLRVVAWRTRSGKEQTMAS